MRNELSSQIQTRGEKNAITKSETEKWITSGGEKRQPIFSGMRS